MKGHSTTVINSKVERQKDIEALGANAAIGTMQDAKFLSATFKGADIVYLIEVWEGMGNIFDKDVDFVAGFTQESGVKRIVHLSSIGAHTHKGKWKLALHHTVENILNRLHGCFHKIHAPCRLYTNLFRHMQTNKLS